MLGQIVEIEGEGRRLTLERGFLAISGPDGPLGKVPLDDIEAVILSSPATSLTAQAIAALAARGAPFVLCGRDYRPAAYLLPVDGHHAQGQRMEAQAEAGLPLRKRLWAEIVRAKIGAQAAALHRCGIHPGPLALMVDRVRSGDVDNLEAQASQRYFPLLYGSKFRRFDEADPTNAFLNYGYTVLRAATARAIVGAGLNPSLALFHRSRGEALRLADDLMEPFRASVDLIAHAMRADGCEDLSPANKRRLAAVLHADFVSEDGRAPLSNVLTRLAISLAQVFLGERRMLALPRSILPMPAAEEDEA